MALPPTFPLPDVGWEPLQPFWAAAAESRLVIPRCARCGAWVWYPKPACRRCGGDDLPWTAVSGRGRLFTWSVVSHPFLPAFRDKVPFVTGLVALEEDPGVRLATEVVDCDPGSLSCDQPVEVTFRPLRFAGVEGTVMAPLWRPVVP